MKKICFLFLILSIFCSISQSYCQDFYHFLVLPKAKIKANYDNKNFRYFIFTFKLIDTAYVLECAAYDNKNDLIDDTFTLGIKDKSSPKPFLNKQRGILRLSKGTMRNNDIRGEEDCFLTPKKYGDGSNPKKVFVSYIIEGAEKLTVRRTILDPSPPAK